MHCLGILSYNNAPPSCTHIFPLPPSLLLLPPSPPSFPSLPPLPSFPLSFRLHFYKQLKKDLVLGKLNVNTPAKAARLTALIAQIDKGEYRSGMQYQQKVTCPSDSDNLDARTRREHQRLAGTSVEIAIEKFLNEGAAMELYGTELYHVIDAYRVPRIIGVGPEGIRVYSSSMEVLSK